MFKKGIIAFFVLCLISTQAVSQFYNGLQTPFGKNRVQYQDFKWVFMSYKNFDVYYYQGGRDVAEFVGKYGEVEMQQIERLLDFNTNGRLQFIVYNKLNDLKQSNIGLENDEPLYNTGGYTKIVGNKILMHFDGNHSHIREQMRAGLSKVLFEQLMYGGNIKERLQSSVLLNIPAWYSEGLFTNIAQGWSIEDNNRMRDIILTGKIKTFNRLADGNELFAGHSMWNYIRTTYGDATVANLLYMARINRNIESGFTYVLGKSSKELSAAWYEFYAKKYLNFDNNKQTPKGELSKLKIRKQAAITKVAVSPDGNKLAYVTNELGRYKVWMYDMRKNKRKVILKGGYKSLSNQLDDSYPLIDWHPAGKYVTMITENKGFTWLNNYYPSTGKKEKSKLLNFEKILHFDYADNGQSFVMSAIKKGVSDIYVWTIRGRTATQITQDSYDDLDPAFADNSTKIIFTSNRENDTLGLNKKNQTGQNQFDVFVYDFANRSNQLVRLTYTPLINETNTSAADSGRFAFVSELNGVQNLVVATLDSSIDYIDTVEHYRYIVRNYQQTNFARNIIDYDLGFTKRRAAYLQYTGGKYKLFAEALSNFELSDSTEVNLFTPIEEPKKDSVKTEAKSTGEIIKTEPVEKIDSSKIDINNYTFQSEFSKKKKKKDAAFVVDSSAVTIDSTKTSTSSTTAIAPEPYVMTSGDTIYIFPKQRNYDVAFNSQYFVSQLDNQLLNATYQTFTGGSPFFDPGLNGLFKIGLTDLMEDYRITAGIRLAGNFNSNEYILGYDNFRNRIDQSVMVYRQSRQDFTQFSLLKITTHEAKYINKYPLNDLTAVRATVSLRNDRLVALSTDYFNLAEKNQDKYWGSGKVEYVYDNTIATGLNLKNGFRYKFFAEVFDQISEKKNLLIVFGFDARHYLKVYKQMIWANRVAGSTGAGDAKLIYYLGGVDNAITPVVNFDNTIRIDNTKNYVFQTLATNMRGFKQNIRNGSSFTLWNSELRIPIFQVLSGRPLRSDFFRSFQLIAFTDVGTAWSGTSPWSPDNNLNLDIIQTGPLTITVKKNTDPIVAGFGWGMHARVLGYFMRADWGYGYADNVLAKKPLFNFSLGLDF